jgi:hypothetical protein
MATQDDGKTGALPRELLVGDAGSFAEQVFTTRHPELIRRILGAGDYNPEQTEALNRLLDESLNGDMRPLPPTADDCADDCARWRSWGHDHFGKPWVSAPFLWAESYFYRRILAATGYFADGAGHGVDPFLSMKNSELRETTTPDSLSWVTALADVVPHEAFSAAVRASVFGNRGDLSFLLAASEHDAAEQFVADDTDALWAAFAARPADVGLVLDNAGRELVADLVLADHLLSSSLARSITLHAKPMPYFVSDATAADIDATVAVLEDMEGIAGTVGRRIRGHLAKGHLSVRSNAVWCAPLPFGDLVDEVSSQLAGHSMVLFKGDLNYRRLVGDRAWDPTVPFASTVANFGVPTAALRTLKSEVVVGVDAAVVAHLDQAEPNWRISGRHGLVQLASREG